ncbi:glycosyltransferase [Sphingobium fuliginis]|jgi:glycosyltransferase involved in cell wall biosynthesis|uniref:glycosyltransferase n=1 Tax=Sphingobium fuliginis (strain ATCC 27551) TaxID=336203 RepID=UPI0037CC9376
MLSKLSRLTLSSRQRQNAVSSRKAGDDARERGQWRRAAEAYDSYLKIRPDDFGIWVQLGHMRKEAGEFDLADRAYERALRLKPNDDDLLLSLGHLRKLQDKGEEAAAFYIRAARDGVNVHALKELRSTWLPDSLRSNAMSELNGRDARSEAIISKSLDGISLISALGFVPGSSRGQLRMTGYDPQILMRFPPKIASAPVVALQIAFERCALQADQGTLFLDIGTGFNSEDFVLLDYPDEPYCAIELLIAAPQAIRALRWDPAEGEASTFVLDYIRCEPIRSIDELMAKVERHHPGSEAGDSDSSDTPSLTQIREGLIPFFQKGKLTNSDRQIMQPFLPPWTERAHGYAHWLHLYGTPVKADFQRMDAMIQSMGWRPRFSFVMPVYNTPPQLLSEIMDAMLKQNYPDFEICIADDCSTDPQVQNILQKYAYQDQRVKITKRKINGHISLCSNSAAKLATGDYVVLVDHDDLIPPYALFVVAAYLNRFPDARIVFSDEDKISMTGERFDPYFKGCYNQYLMYGHNMVSHLGVYHRPLFEAVGGFRKGLEGSQDYDLFLRCSERVDPHQIIHIPHVLYHWRQVPGSTAISADQKDYAILAARSSIGGHMERLRLPLTSVKGHAPGNSAIAVPRELDTRVSIIIPTRNGVDLLDDCLASIARHNPDNVEILIIDNDSDEAETLNYLESVTEKYPKLDVQVIAAPGPFNFSAINNLAATRAKGEILCFLNNDTEVIESTWLDRARGLLAMGDVGIVGARLLYPDRSIQHFGLVTGMYKHAVAGGVHLFENSHGYGYFSKHRMIGEFTAVTAACLFVRREDFEAVGGFEPQLAVAYNDVDFCLKIRALGRRVLCDPMIQLVHKESKSRGHDVSTQKAARLDREALWMRERWGGRLLEDPYYSSNLSIHRSDFALAYPPRQPWPWSSHNDKPNIASGAIARAPRFVPAGRTGDRGYLAICAILKNEAINILEWIAYHRAIGVEKFYLYDNNSTDHVKDLVEALILDGIVDLIPWPINPGQIEAYDDFADRHGHNWTWAAFIDLDEFINPFGHASLVEWLEGFADASAIAIQWFNFGPNGHDVPPPGLLIESYTTRLCDDHVMHGHVKTIVRMADYDRAQGPHSFHVRGKVVDEYGEEIDQSVNYGLMQPKQHQAICINHYYTRSRQEWQSKIERGLADHGPRSQTVRNPAWIEIYEREATISDNRITKFAEATRKVMSDLNLPIGPQYPGPQK